MKKPSVETADPTGVTVGAVLTVCGLAGLAGGLLSGGWGWLTLASSIPCLITGPVLLVRDARRTVRDRRGNPIDL